MFAICLACGVACLIWMGWAMRYHSILLGAAIFLVATCCFPSEYFGIEVGGLTVSVDRLWMAMLLTQFGIDLYLRRGVKLHFGWVDATLAAFLVWLVLRTFSQPLGTQVHGQPSTVMHLINGYIVPAILFWTVRSVRIDAEKLWPAITLILIFGMYLSVTAVFEIAKMWSFVYPQVIADPTLGIHFGRARGPMLQSVRLGVCLNFCLALVWLFPLWLHRGQRWAWGLAMGLSAALLTAIYLTYTRSIWMGTAAITVILLITLLQGRWRSIALGSLAFGLLVGGLVIGPSLVAFKREYGEAETRESTYMRAAFAYVSGKMLMDRPLAGFGFNQFQVYNRDYLSDRTTDIRLESIRGYVHHNSYLSILVDLGLIGGTLYVIAVSAMLRPCWQMWRLSSAPEWARATACLGFCVAAVHAIQMAFHEVSFSSIENSVVMIVMGCVIAAHEQFSEMKATRLQHWEDSTRGRTFHQPVSIMQPVARLG